MELLRGLLKMTEGVQGHKGGHFFIMKVFKFDLWTLKCFQVGGFRDCKLNISIDSSLA